MNKKILLVGTVSNVSKTIERELRVVLKALSGFESVDVYLVESDSTDETNKVLHKIQLMYHHFNFISMGSLKDKHPDRIARIAYCRNIYIRYIRANFEINKWDYVAVADLDGMNLKLTRKGIESCFTTKIDWDGVMANQIFGYYDILALRANGWVERDCFQEIKIARQKLIPPKQYKNIFLNFIILFKYYDQFRKLIIYDKMKILPRRKGLIKVESAFGGFAIYKSKSFMVSEYDPSNSECSEHVDFHRRLGKYNYQFFINTSLINNWFNVYNLNKILLIRLGREIRSYYNKSKIK